jgi:6-phosphogluconate dehydrogenase (decarboxylating)
MIKKLEGGVALTKDDLEEKNEITNYDFNRSRVTEEDDERAKDKKMDDLTPREAQKETFQLINTVKQLKSTVTELAPLLKEGKSILSTLGALKV